jgi:hypothetical protein
MAYLRLSDDMPDHPKISGLSAESFRFWITANCWCQKHLTDGKIPTSALRSILHYTPKRAAELVQAGLWIETADGFQVHDFLAHNDSRERVIERRSGKAARVARWRERHARNGNGNALRDALPVETSNASRNPAPHLTSPYVRTDFPNGKSVRKRKNPDA